MIDHFVPYQEALELKSLGFDKPCLCLYVIAVSLEKIAKNKI